MMRLNIVTVLAASTLAGCTSRAEWSARAAMAQADAAARTAEADARAAAAVANANADIATTAIWAGTTPGLLLLVAVVVLMLVVLWLWNQHARRQAELERIRLITMAQILQLPAPTLAARTALPAPRNKWQLAPDEIPACRRPLPDPLPSLLPRSER